MLSFFHAVMLALQLALSGMHGASSHYGHGGGVHSMDGSLGGPSGG